MPVLSGESALAGVLGWPVTQSRSPRLHGYWLERHGIDGAYLPLPVRPADLPTAVRGLVTAGFAGANVTIPHKEAALAVCDAVDPSAARAGAVNTLVFRDGRVRGSNTDGRGFIANLRAHGVATEGPALILGAGGSARAIAAALLDEGADVAVCGRRRDRADALAADLPGRSVGAWPPREAPHPKQALLVNTTPLGMGADRSVPLVLERAPSALAVADIVYVPLETPLLAAARARGLRAVDGLGMLLHQAVPGFAAWFGVEPTVDDDLRRFVAADLIG